MDVTVLNTKITKLFDELKNKNKISTEITFEEVKEIIINFCKDNDLNIDCKINLKAYIKPKCNKDMIKHRLSNRSCDDNRDELKVFFINKIIEDFKNNYFVDLGGRNEDFVSNFKFCYPSKVTNSTKNMNTKIAAKVNPIPTAKVDTILTSTVNTNSAIDVDPNPTANVDPNPTESEVINPTESEVINPYIDDTSEEEYKDDFEEEEKEEKGGRKRRTRKQKKRRTRKQRRNKKSSRKRQ